MEKTTITILVVVTIAILVGSVYGIIQIKKASALTIEQEGKTYTPSEEHTPAAQGVDCNTTWSKKCEDDSQLAMQKQDCLRLKADATDFGKDDVAASELYKSKNCDDLK